MKFLVKIDLENAAFEDSNMGTELARILRKVADTMEGMHGAERPMGEVKDINGNFCGRWAFTR